jgi:hypothetical protein
MTTAPADLEIGVPIRTGLFGGGVKMRPSESVASEKRRVSETVWEWKAPGGCHAKKWYGEGR